MRAIRFHEYGAHDSLRFEEVAEPTFNAQELLLQVEAAGINRADLLRREGRYPLETRLPAIPGIEACGRVIGIGEAVQGFELGQRVFGLLPGGGYADRVAMAAPMAIPLLEQLSPIEAAAIPVAFLTAWHTLAGRARLRSGEWVLVHSAGSGVGTAAIQVAKHLGARVIATAGSAEKLRRAADLGADAVVDYNGDFVSAVRQATGGKGADVILDGVGAPTFHGNMECLAAQGRIVIIGWIGGTAVNLDLGQLLGKNPEIHGFSLARLGRPLFALVQRFREQLLPLFAAGTLRSVVDRTFPLSEAAEAHRYLTDRKNFGKVVLVP